MTEDIFRTKYRELTTDEKELLEIIKNKANELNTLFNVVASPGRYKSLAVTSLEQSVMWIVKEVTG